MEMGGGEMGGWVRGNALEQINVGGGVKVIQGGGGGVLQVNNCNA